MSYRDLWNVHRYMIGPAMAEEGSADGDMDFLNCCKLYLAEWWHVLLSTFRFLYQIVALVHMSVHVGGHV